MRPKLRKKETTLGDFGAQIRLSALAGRTGAQVAEDHRPRGGTHCGDRNDRDPATPYEYAVGMANQLISGEPVTFRGYGHLAYSQSPCVRRAVQAYLNDDVVPGTGRRADAAIGPSDVNPGRVHEWA